MSIPEQMGQAEGSCSEPRNGMSAWDTRRGDPPARDHVLCNQSLQIPLIEKLFLDKP